MEASTTRPAPALSALTQADWLRMLGGVAFAVGAVVLFIRKSGGSEADPWADFPLLLVIGIPCLALYWLGISGRREAEVVEPWRSVLMVAGVLLAPLFLTQLRDTIGLSETSNFWIFCIFAGTAAMAAYASFVIGAAYQALLAALAGIVAWLFLWEWILDDPGASVFRILLIVLGAGYLAWAVSLQGAGVPQGSEIITAAGICGLLVGTIGVLDGAAEALGGAFIPGAELADGGPGGQSFFWDLVLLLVSLALVAYGAWARARGPSYVGFIGLLAFTILLGAEVSNLLEGDERDGGIVGWPLVLLIIGGAALALGATQERQEARPAPAPPASPPPVAPPPPPTA